MISCFLNNGLHVYPKSNLIINTGVGKDATHTTEFRYYWPTSYGKSLSFPLTVPKSPCPADEVDKWIENHIYSKSPIERFLWLINKLKLTDNDE